MEVGMLTFKQHPQVLSHMVEILDLMEQTVLEEVGGYNKTIDIPMLLTIGVLKSHGVGKITLID